MPKKKCNKHGEYDGEECPTCKSEAWDPSQPLDDDEAEEEAQSRARAHSRFEFLKTQNLAKVQEGSRKKKKSGSGSVFD